MTAAEEQVMEFRKSLHKETVKGYVGIVSGISCGIGAIYYSSPTLIILGIAFITYGAMKLGSVKLVEYVEQSFTV